MITIKKGLDLPITGEPAQSPAQGNSVSSVALVGYDYNGMKPTMLVREGDRVKIGQPVFTDKKTEGVTYTAPGAGVVRAINRGKRRVFQSLVIDLDKEEEAETFEAWSADKLASLDRQAIVDQLVKSGEWTLLRTRPFSKVPSVDSEPRALFVNAMDSNPLAADPAVVLQQGDNAEAFRNGLSVVSRLTEGTTYVTKAPGADIPVTDNVRVEEFGGVHPAGNTGTHIHFLEPVSLDRTVWSLGYQDVIAIGRLFTTGRISLERTVALGGPMVREPRLLVTRVGANLADLTRGELSNEESRVISGSVWGGRAVVDEVAWLGRKHTQISVLREGNDRPMLHYLRAGTDKFSVLNLYVSKLMGGKRFAFDTTTNGSQRAMLPLGQYEKVMPLDILPTQLLRAIASGDMDQAEALGALELEEEDLALCSFVCAGKYEYGPILREALTTIEKEG